MNAEMSKLVQASARGDKHAFGKIVERYQGAVSAVAYSVTGDLTQSEDLAQEAFVIGWEKLGTLHKRESVAAWLCGIARNLARDWMRKRSKSPTVSLDRAGELAQPAADSVEESCLHRDRSEAVWGALTAIPETYREPLVLFYRQDRSIRDIADALDVTESCVKQRLSRGRKMLRAEVARMVEDTLEESRPGKAFTAGVLATLPHLGMPGAPMPQAGAPALLQPAGALAMTAPAKLLAVAALALVVLGGLWGTRQAMRRMDGDGSNATQQAPIAHSSVSQKSTVPFQNAPESEVDPDPSANAVADTGNSGSASSLSGTVSGVVVFKGTDEPAEGMRVLLGTKDGEPVASLTDAEGRFAFSSIGPGEWVMLAYDARYDELPEDWLRSEHLALNLAEGEAADDVRIEVPSQGGEISGRVTDRKTGAPLYGITVKASRPGTTSHTYEGRTDQDGHYVILGLPEGEWLAFLSRNNPVFRSGSTESMNTVVVKAGATVRLDLAVDRGVSISGRVVNAESEPIPNAIVESGLFLADRSDRLDCYFRTNTEGEFTVWGTSPGDRAVLSARKDDLKSHIAVVNPVPNEAIADVILTLRPAVRVSGRFVDERGRPVNAVFWWRPVHPDGHGTWRGQGLASTQTFETELAQGDYEVKGQPKGNDFGVEQPAQPLHVGTTSVSNVTIQILTSNELVGEHALRGRVVDEDGKPLKNTRVYVDGAARENFRSFQETRTDAQGRFSFDGLLDTRYRVHATPAEPFESYSGYDDVNPAETPEITIVARLAPSLRGRVLDAATDEPITTFRVECGRLGLYDQETRWERRNISSENGEFSLPARPDHDWYVRVEADGYAMITQTGQALSSGETVDDIEFRLSPGRVVRGTVTNEGGEPLPGVLIYHNEDAFDPSLRRPRHAATQTDADAQFELRSLPEEAQFLYAVKSGYAIAQASIDDEMRIVLTQGGAIEGRILIGGAPPQGEARVAAVGFGTGHSRRAKVDENGFYALAELMDAAYRLHVRVEDDTASGIAYRLADPVEASSGNVVTCDIAIPLGTAAVAGTLTQNGVPVAHLPLLCWHDGYEIHRPTDEAGRYRFDRLPAGTVHIRALTPNEGRPETWGYRNILSLELQPGAEVQQDGELADLK